jgi:chemotaxis family two-component system sensor kinase Cph1
MAQPAVSFTDESLLGTTITLTNCDREPIHIPGLVQPYGFMLCLDEHTQRVVQASENTQELIGIAAKDLLGKGLEQLLSPTRLAEVNALWPTLTEAAKLIGARLDQVEGQPFYKLILHRYDGLLWVECEPLADNEASALDLPALNTTLSQMLEATNLLDFCQAAVGQVRDITGFARVAMYRFAADESGEVVAEAKRDDLDPLLGLHYPASDIPQQARAMYLKNWLRFIPDIDYAPSPLLPARNHSTGRPPDMTYSVLRSVSPIHIQYLRNMGVAATMTISVIQNGKLWGMIMCHHDSPRLVSYELRELCLFIGKTFSALLSTKEQLETHAYELRIQQAQARLFEQLNAHTNFLDGLHLGSPKVNEVFDCGGAAICFEGELITLGNTPTPPQILELVAWLQQNMRQDLVHTNSYAQLNPEGIAMRATASGVLAITLSQAPGDYLLWFRPELLHTVRWAGKHEKVEKMEDGQLFLSPSRKHSRRLDAPGAGSRQRHPAAHCRHPAQDFQRTPGPRRQPGPPQPRTHAQQRRVGFVCLRGLARLERATSGHSQLLDFPARRLRRLARCGGSKQAENTGALKRAHGGINRLAAATLARGPARPRSARD